jgi:protein arginine N-methyltransferase 3
MSPPQQDADPRAEDSYSDSDSASDILNPANDEGWEDVEPEDDSQPVVGLFSADVYPDVRVMLKETKERYNFDLVKVQKDFGVWSMAGIETKIANSFQIWTF